MALPKTLQAEVILRFSLAHLIDNRGQVSAVISIKRSVSVEMVGINYFRKPILFLCDSAILIVAAVSLSLFSLRYSIPDAVSSGKLLPHLVMLYACTVIFQLFFRTYDSLWRYAESREYLSLLMAALFGFCIYEITVRYFIQVEPISFLLLTSIAGK